VLQVKPLQIAILSNRVKSERGTTTRTVDNFIVRFRKYFEGNPKKPVYFKSLRSVGYVLDHDPDQDG